VQEEVATKLREYLNSDKALLPDEKEGKENAGCFMLKLTSGDEICTIKKLVVNSQEFKT
jgi:hypothetical protein